LKEGREGRKERMRKSSEHSYVVSKRAGPKKDWVGGASHFGGRGVLMEKERRTNSHDISTYI